MACDVQRAMRFTAWRCGLDQCGFNQHIHNMVPKPGDTKQFFPSYNINNATDNSLVTITPMFQAISNYITMSTNFINVLSHQNPAAFMRLSLHFCEQQCRELMSLVNTLFVALVNKAMKRLFKQLIPALFVAEWSKS